MKCCSKQRTTDRRQKLRFNPDNDRTSTRNNLPPAGAVFCITPSSHADLWGWQIKKWCSSDLLYSFSNIAVVHSRYTSSLQTCLSGVLDGSPLFMTVMWWNSQPSAHLHLDLPQTTLYLDPAADLHNWRSRPAACYSLTWHCREADGEMYWTDCSSSCQGGLATSWQKGPEENSFAPNTTSNATSESFLFIYSRRAELQIDMQANI